VESTRSHLSRAIHAEHETLARGLGRWLRADATLRAGASGDDPVRPQCARALRDFRAWLKGSDPALVGRARAALGGDRAAALAGTFLLEHLKTEGLLDPLSREQRDEADALLETFFRSLPPAAVQ